MGKIMYKGQSYAGGINTGGGGGSEGDSTAIPTASTTAKFDTAAHMNSEDMTTPEITSFIENLDVSNNGAIADFVVEQGTSGIWTYRKWNSGIAECWGTHTASLTHYAGPYGNFYGYSSVVAFPSGLFIERPVASHNCAIGTVFAMPASNLGVSNTSYMLYALAATSGTQSCTFDIQAKGKWK